MGWGRSLKDKWGFLRLVPDGEACRDTSVWLKCMAAPARDQTVISKPINLAYLQISPCIRLPPTLRRTDWHLLRRISLQNIKCISSLYSRLNKLPSNFCVGARNGNAWVFCFSVLVFVCFLEGFLLFVCLFVWGGDGRKEPNTINDQSLEKSMLISFCLKMGKTHGLF